ncbi:hypothetical protein FQZ97_796510 [compost metagenome]
MCVDVLHRIRLNACLPQCGPHASLGSVTVLRSCGYVIGIGAGAVSDDLGNGPGAASQGMFQALDKHQPCPLGDDESITFRIEGTRGFLRAVIEAGSQCLGRDEPANTDFVDTGLTPAAECNIRFIVLNQTNRVPNCLHASGACSCRCS